MSTIDQMLLAQRKQHGLLPIYRLRWALELATGKVIYSGWDCMGRGTLPAWSINKTGLKRAFIQGEKIQEYHIKNLLEIDGDKYASCRWVAGVSAGGWSVGSKSYAPTCIGLTMTTNDHAYTVFRDGTGKTEKLSDYDKKFNIREHRGGE